MYAQLSEEEKMYFSFHVQKNIDVKSLCSWAFPVYHTGNGLVVQNKLAYTSSGSPTAKANTASHCYLASLLWDVQTFPSSSIQESCGRRNKVEKGVISHDEKQRETPSTISLKSHWLCLSFPSKTWSTKISCVHTPEGSKPAIQFATTTDLSTKPQKEWLAD